MAESVDIKLFGLDSNGRISLSYQPASQANEKEAIIQSVINNLMTTPGRDAFNPTRGGGLLSLLRSTRGFDEVVNELSSIISYVKTEAIEDQSNNPGTYSVDDIRISDITYDRKSGIYFTLTIVFDNGEEETISF